MNPRTGCPAYRISSADPSATWVHLHDIFHYIGERGKGQSFFVIGNSIRIPYYKKSPTGQDRTAAEQKRSLEATRRRRRILQAGFFFILTEKE